MRMQKMPLKGYGVKKPKKEVYGVPQKPAKQVYGGQKAPKPNYKQQLVGPMGKIPTAIQKRGPMARNKKGVTPRPTPVRRGTR